MKQQTQQTQQLSLFNFNEEQIISTHTIYNKEGNKIKIIKTLKNDKQRKCNSN